MAIASGHGYRLRAWLTPGTSQSGGRLGDSGRRRIWFQERGYRAFVWRVLVATRMSCGGSIGVISAPSSCAVCSARRISASESSPVQAAAMPPTCRKGNHELERCCRWSDCPTDRQGEPFAHFSVCGKLGAFPQDSDVRRVSKATTSDRNSAAPVRESAILTLVLVRRARTASPERHCRCRCRSWVRAASASRRQSGDVALPTAQ